MQSINEFIKNFEYLVQSEQVTVLKQDRFYGESKFKMEIILDGEPKEVDLHIEINNAAKAVFNVGHKIKTHIYGENECSRLLEIMNFACFMYMKEDIYVKR